LIRQNSTEKRPDAGLSSDDMRSGRFITP
jgi:hypothetical protein